MWLLFDINLVKVKPEKLIRNFIYSCILLGWREQLFITTRVVYRACNVHSLAQPAHIYYRIQTHGELIELVGSEFWTNLGTSRRPASGHTRVSGRRKRRQIAAAEEAGPAVETRLPDVRGVARYIYHACMTWAEPSHVKHCPELRFFKFHKSRCVFKSWNQD